MPAVLFTPTVVRRESLRGVDTYAYGQHNALHREAIGGQVAPDPIRYGLTPARPAKQYIAIMSTRPGDWGTGMMERFFGDPDYVHVMPGRQRVASYGMNAQLTVRAQNSMGIRPNIESPAAVTYGSLFQLGSQTYDIA